MTIQYSGSAMAKMASVTAAPSPLRRAAQLTRLGMRFVCVMACISLAACGFHLRGSDGRLNLPFKTIALAFPDSSLVGFELTRNLRALGGTEIVADRKSAQAVLEILTETKNKTVLSLNFQGRVREFSLAYTLGFRVVDKDGKELLAPTEIALKRTISFNESQVLAKEAEETLLYRDMQTDLVQQVLRRLSALKPE